MIVADKCMSVVTLKVLLVEDNPDDALLLRRMLRNARDVRFELEHADKISAALERIAEGGLDVVLLDLSLPDSQGLDTFFKVHALAPEVPIVVLTGLDNESLAYEAVQEGAQEYLVKGKADSDFLVRSIRYAIERHRMQATLIEDIKRRKLVEEELRLNYNMQSVLNELLRIPLLKATIEEQLEKILEQIISIPWFALDSKGAIFLLDDETGALIMKAQNNLDSAIVEGCSRAPFEQCICGRATSSGPIVFSESDAECHKNLKEFVPNSHYCIPIKSNEKTLGVLSLYFPAGHRRNEREEVFIRAVADVVAVVIEHNRTENDREKLRQQLLQSQKMEAVGQLAGGIAHDFNNMLTVIMGNTQLAMMDLDSGGPTYQELSEVLETSDRAKALTMKLLTFARKEKISVSTVPTSNIIKKLTDILERSFDRKITIKTMLSKNVLPVEIDSNQMLQALLNVCNNARDAMPEGGTLIIEDFKVALDETSLEGHAVVAPGNYCLIRISDTGVGMTKEVMRKIFEPFFTMKAVGKGTGLGLSVTLGIIKNHSGYINVLSEPDRGTTVNIYLPYSKNSEPVKENNVSEHIKRGAETILVVDDEESVLRLGGKLLNSAGYKVLLAPGGKEAVAIYNNSHDKIALVLLDMMMPEMDGREVYRELVKIDSGVKVILSSGYSIDGQAGEMMSAGIRAFVQKPYKVTELFNKVREVIDV
jgi:two-component system, cell cycle sensor histidine kinase and response regulator CckA